MKFIFLCLGLLFAQGVEAQISSQELYFANQWGGYYTRQYQNNAWGYRARSVGMPITCPVSSLDQASLWELGEDFLKKSHWKESIKAYSASIYQDSSFCDAYFRLAQALVAANDLDQSMLVLKIAERKFPRQPMVYLGMGQVSLLRKDTKEGLFYYTKMTELAPNDIEGFVGCSLALSEMGRDDEALEYFDKGGGNSSYTYVLLGAFLNYKSHHTQKALEKIEILHGNSFEDALQRNLLGLCYFAKGEHYYKNARTNFLLAAAQGIPVDAKISKLLGLSIDPTDFKNLALVQFYDDDINCATLDKESKAATQEADLLFENRKLELAIPEYQTLIQNNPLNCHAQIKLAECYVFQDQHFEALKLYKDAYSTNPKEKEIGLLLARQFFRMDSLVAATKVFEQIIQLDSTEDRAFVGGSLALAQRGKKDDALKFVIRRERPQGTFTPWNVIATEGMLYYYSGDITKAIDYLKKASYHSKNGWTNYHLGLCYSLQGDKFSEKAKEYMQRAIDEGAVVSPEIEKKFGLTSKNQAHP